MSPKLLEQRPVEQGAAAKFPRIRCFDDLGEGRRGLRDGAWKMGPQEASVFVCSPRSVVELDGLGITVCTVR